MTSSSICSGSWIGMGRRGVDAKALRSNGSSSRGMWISKGLEGSTVRLVGVGVGVGSASTSTGVRTGFAADGMRKEGARDGTRDTGALLVPRRCTAVVGGEVGVLSRRFEKDDNRLPTRDARPVTGESPEFCLDLILGNFKGASLSLLNSLGPSASE